jgi:hypothetical protein
MTNSEKFLTQLGILGEDVKARFIKNTIEMNKPGNYGEWFLYEKDTPHSFSGAFIFNKSKEGHKFWKAELEKFEELTNYVPEYIKRLQVTLTEEECEILKTIVTKLK